MGAPVQDVIIDNNGNAAEVVLPLHGQIANTPARKVSIEITDTEIILHGEVDETMLFSPAQVAIHNLTSGRTHRSGQLNPSLLQSSLLEG